VQSDGSDLIMMACDNAGDFSVSQVGWKWSKIPHGIVQNSTRHGKLQDLILLSTIPAIKHHVKTAASTNAAGMSDAEKCCHC